MNIIRLKKLFIFSIILLLINNSFAQDYSVDAIPPEIKENAYAVFRLNETTVEYKAYNRLNIKREMVITILNEAGNAYATYPVYYNNSTKINRTSATIYDANGKKIRELKSKDLKDQSAVDGFSMYLDDRLKYYSFANASIPYTIHYVFETSTTNTLFIPSWYSVDNYNVGTEISRYNFINHTNLPIRIKESGFEFGKVTKTEENNKITYEALNIPPIGDEIMSPSLTEIIPRVIFAPKEFELEGVRGSFENWTDFGKWYLENLLKDKQDLPEIEKKQVRELVDGISDPTEKVRILYDYLQTKTRYINVSIGIGGWKPYPASYVNNKGYGDCKALSNYMMALLEAVGVESFYTIVNSDRAKKVNIDPDFAHMTGNHIILQIPNGDETIWLECTSQQTAFNFLGSSTDDRYALAITPEGGKIVSTQKFPSESNLEQITGSGTIYPDGKLSAEINTLYKGLKYDRIYPIYYENSVSKKRIFNLIYEHLPSLNLIEFQVENNRDKAELITQVKLESGQFARKVGNNLVVNLIPSRKNETSLKKDDHRKFPFEIRYGYQDTLEFEYKISSNYQLEGDFETIELDSEFGNYYLSVTHKDDSTLLVKRTIHIYDGDYPKEKFNQYVDFRRKIATYEGTKILLELK